MNLVKFQKKKMRKFIGLGNGKVGKAYKSFGTD